MLQFTLGIRQLEGRENSCRHAGVTNPLSVN